MSYDVYYSTGGSMVYGDSDVWVNYWLENVGLNSTIQVNY